MIGWIKLHRSIQEHWIFKDESKLKAWLIILITVNYEDKKVNFGNTLIECKRGESLLSLDSWAKKFGGTWNKSKVRRFFKLLENDSMIVTQSEQKTTRLTVCNYESYQDERHANDTQTTRKRHANDTQTTPTKEIKEIEEEKEKIQLIYNLYPSKCPIKNTSTGKTAKNKDKIKSLLKSMSADKLTSIINRYIKESTEGKVYFKNFGTLLNNLPDYSEPKKPKEVLYNYHAEGYGMQYRRTKKQMEHDRAICQGRISKITEIKQ